MNNHKHLVDSKRKIVFLILILGSITAIGPLTIDMYLPAFSAIAKSFSASDDIMFSNKGTGRTSHLERENIRRQTCSHRNLFGFCQR